jgi:hypothetical protein
MALFGSYAQPGVYTSVVIDGGGQPLFGSARIPVIIGEGLEYFEKDNVEIHRGSSAVADDQVVNENISDQITGTTRSFTTTYFPVVTGDGSGTVTNDPTKIQVTADGVPVTVVSLVGATGAFQTQDIIATGANLEVNYNFKRTDTLISAENLSAQVPAFASLTVAGAAASHVTITTTLPGAVGNDVSIALFDSTLLSPPSPGVVDALAVTGYGTDTIGINIRKADNSVRTVVDLFNLVEAGILTLSAGYLAATTATGTGALSVTAAANLAGGEGPNSNTVFKVKHVPIVDGTNGGVVTTDPTKVTAFVDGTQVAVVAVDGANGLVTLANAVAFSHSLAVTYYTNTYQDTYDLLPASNVASILEVGLGPNRSDYTDEVDYVLSKDGAGNPVIQWGASTSTVAGKATTGFTPFGPTQITTNLVDEHVFLQFAGTGDGKTTLFTLPDSPTDGSGLSRVTDDPAKISVYIGADPYTAYQSGTVTVARLSGASAQVTLYNPPAAGQKVYASYYRNTLNDHTYTLSVVAPAQSGVGTYTIKNELGYVLPQVSNGANTVAAGAFATTGIVYPNSFSDAWTEPNAVDETVTLTFNNDGTTIITPATQAHVTTQTIVFTATTPGTAGNSVTLAFTSVGVADATAITTSGNAVTVDILKADNTTVRTITEIVALFATYGATRANTTGGGVITASGSGSGQAAVAGAVNLAGGTAATTAPFTKSFTVTSSAGASGSAGIGYLDQTYIDALTGFKVTVVNPADALGFGYTSLPSPQYKFAPGDTLTYVVSKSAARYTGQTYVPFGTAQPNSLIAIPGITTKVATTFGANAGDTAIVTTNNKSGNEPNVGEFYYVSFTVNKTSDDMAIKLFNNPADAYAQYGQPSVINRVSLGISLMSQNGVQTFGVVQVPKQPGLNVASDNSFIAAIQSLTVNLPGLTKKADVIVPLSTSPTVHQFLSRQLTTQANVRFKGEAIGFVGYSQFTTPAQAIANATGLKNARVIAIGNPVAGLQVTDPLTAVALEYAVSGEFIAAAMAGLNTNPANDVATTLTLQNLVGFTRLLVRYDDSTMNNMAAQGLVLLTDNSGALNIRHYKSTDPSNPITSEPTCTTIIDYTRQLFRSDLNQFIGRKLVDSLVNDITAVCNSRLRSLVNNEILAGYKNLVVTPDASDPTTVDVTVTVKPVFSLLYISVTFTVTTTL